MKYTLKKNGWAYYRGIMGDYHIFGSNTGIKWGTKREMLKLARELRDAEPRDWYSLVESYKDTYIIADVIA